MVKENEIVRDCLAALERNGIMSWRNNAAHVAGRTFRGLRGVPDIIGILPDGKFLGVECKTESGKQSADQIDFQARCTVNGGLYILAKSALEVITTLVRAGYLDDAIIPY